MVGGGFARVVGKGALFGNRRIGTGRNHQAGLQSLCLPDFLRLIRHQERTCYIDRVGQRPLVIRNRAPFVWRDENPGSDNDVIYTAIGENDLLEHRLNALTLCDIYPEADRRSTTRDASTRNSNADTIHV